MLQNIEFIQNFVEEAKVHVETVETGLLQLDITAVDAECINNIFRAVHSMKGTAGFFNLTKIVELSHSMENILGEVRAGKMSITDVMVDTLLSSNDCLKTMVDDVLNSEDTEISAHLEKLADILSGRSGSKSKDRKAEGHTVPNESGKNANYTISQKEHIRDLLEHGQKLYKLTQNLNMDLDDIDIIQLLRKVKSIGSIINSSIGPSAVAAEAGHAGEDYILECIFTSVLEKDLLPSAIDIPEECLAQVDFNDSGEKTAANAAESSAEENTVKNVAHAAPEAPSEEASTKKNHAVPVEDSIRVHITLLNNLLNLASEMVLARNQLMRAMETHRKSISGIEPILQNIDHITTDLQEKIMQTRMQPIANVFNKFPRIIRELSKKLGKEMDLKLEGTEVELDKSIIEALGDPLTHLVRNAADHGLESPSERESAGKSRTGTIIMKAYHEGGYVNIDVIDDGKGIDIERVRNKALEKEFITKADVNMMGEQEILQLLFKPGFSTADKVTDVSGRGVGMDVVKTNIEKLGGTIEIFTASMKGTTFRLLLPLTLAIIPSLIVEVENQKYALPQVNLQEIVRIRANDPSRRIEYVNNSEVLRLRGRLLPIIHLGEVIGLERTYIDPDTGIRHKEKRKTLFDTRRTGAGNEIPEEIAPGNSERRNLNPVNTVRILVIKIGSRRLGIAVDAIHGGEEILVKPLPVHVKDCKCYSGVTILGDGRTSMILDPGGIIEKANLRFLEGYDDNRDKDEIEAAESMLEQQNLLIFKCSGPETLALDLSMVSRVEEIKNDQLESIGSKEYIKFRGNTLRVIRPEDFLPINKYENNDDKSYVIIPKLVKHPIGILISKIHDTVQTNVKLKQDDIIAKGLIGSSILNNRIVLLVNMYELFELADPEHYSTVKQVKAGEKMSVLLVEDTPFFLRLEKDYLETSGYNVFAAQNGREAMKLLQEEHVDAVVSDIHMPLMDGLELVKRIRADKALSELPVIAVTSMTGDLQKKAGLEAGFDAYEFKLDRNKLLDTLQQAINKRRADQ